MPPQQSHGLLDVIDDGLDFGAHGFTQLIPNRNLVSEPAQDKAAGFKVAR
jgi:hypothetical protein